MKFSKKELKDLFFAWVLISIAFAILFSGLKNFLMYLFVSMFTVGVGFLFHELMHKYYAQKYGLWAEFRAFYRMLFFAIALSFFGFIFAAPGAVIIRGSLSREKNGKISLAGPITNIILAFVFLILLILYSPQKEIIQIILSLGLRINALLAVFNLLPIPSFDGKKIYEWNKLVYFASIITATILLLIGFL
jgi:Zn-dependent protease